MGTIAPKLGLVDKRGRHASRFLFAAFILICLPFSLRRHLGADLGGDRGAPVHCAPRGDQ